MGLNLNNNLSPWLDKLPFQWNTLESYGTYHHVEKGIHIFHYEDDMDSVFVVKSGRVRLYLITPNGKEKTIAIIGENGLLGEEWLSTHELYITSAIAVSDCCILKVDKEIFKEISLQDQKLTAQWLEMLSMKLELLTQASLKLSFDNSLKNVANTFIELANMYGEFKENRVKIDITFTHQELADLIGMTRVTVSNTIKRLYEMDIVEKVNRYYYIKDIEKLRGII